MCTMATGAQADSSISERERVLTLLRRHGFNTTSFQALEDGLSYWWHDEDARSGTRRTSTASSSS